MSLEALSKEQIADYETALLDRIPPADSIGNVSLKAKMSSLGWDDERYWEIRNRLIENGVLQKGRGQGGSVKRVQAEVEATPAKELTEISVAAARDKEADLYPPMSKVIQTRWAQDFRMDAIIVEVTALGGGKVTGGKWTRPDITVGGYRTFPYVPGKHFDLIVFEVKPYWAIDVTVVYEALGHRRAANRAYALIHVPADKKSELDAVVDEVALEAKRFGVGLIVAERADDYGTWEEIVEAVRHEPDPERMNEFLAQQVSQGFREQIMKWFK